MNRLATRTASRRATAGATAIVAVFNLEDLAERFMLEVMQRFHGEDRLYRAHAIRRTTDNQGHRVVLEVASFQPRRRGARREWMMIAWNIDEVSIRFHRHRTKRSATEAVAK